MTFFLKSNKSDLNKKINLEDTPESRTPNFTEYELHLFGELNQGIAQLTRNIARLDGSLRQFKTRLEEEDGDSDSV